MGAKSFRSLTSWKFRGLTAATITKSIENQLSDMNEEQPKYPFNSKKTQYRQASMRNYMAEHKLNCLEYVNVHLGPDKRDADGAGETSKW